MTNLSGHSSLEGVHATVRLWYIAKKINDTSLLSSHFEYALGPLVVVVDSRRYLLLNTTSTPLGS